MTSPILTQTELGWSAYFNSQLELDEINAAIPFRLTQIHRDRAEAMGEAGPATLPFTGDQRAGDFAVGDWVLANPTLTHITRRLDRLTCLSRKAAGEGSERQLIAANVDTLFITTSCNADFNPARLERYIAMALEAEAMPVILLTKPDLCEDAEDYLNSANQISNRAEAILINAKGSDVAETLAPWIGVGQTVALLGSSGVGKSTLTSALTGEDTETATIREADAKGRHTTTARSMHRIPDGGWLIDTPGMRELAMKDAADGIDALFADIVELIPNCRFRDCAHASEPGCAVQAAIQTGQLDADRLERWKKLRAEDTRNSETVAQARRRDKSFGKMVKGAVGAKKRTRGG